MPDLDMIERVREWLEWPDGTQHVLVELDDAGPREMVLPGDDDLRATMTKLDIPPHTHDEIVATAPRDLPEAWWLLERIYRQLTRPERDAPQPVWAAPVVRDDPLSRYFHLYAYLAAVPDVLELHGERDIPADVTWNTLRDIGLQVAHHQARHGKAGFDGAFWMWTHFRGEVFRLGRLQYNHSLLGFDANGYAAGDDALDTHIPATGPLTPEAVEDSFTQARDFFPRHFPETPYLVARCESWLLDPQLADYLPGDSNIVRFGRRFTLTDDTGPVKDEDVLIFAFGKPIAVDDVPQNSSVERALVKHIRGGGHWYFRRGWFEL